MKRVIVTFFSLVFILSLSIAKGSNKPADKAPAATSSLSGKVIDKVSGEELTGVPVKIKGTDNVCYTDFDGNFHFENLLPGTYDIGVEMISYKNIEIEKIEVGAQEAHELNIKLKQEI